VPPPEQHRAGKQGNAYARNRQREAEAEPERAAGVSSRPRRRARTPEAERFGQNRTVDGRPRARPLAADE